MKNSDKKLIEALPWIMSVALMLAVIKVSKDGKADNDFKDADTVTVYDTIPCYKPVPKDSTVIRYITRRLPIVDDKEDNFPNKGNNDEQNIPQTGNNVAENIPDSAEVVVPITQKVYGDNTYRAWVSGYEARLDSFHVYRQTEYVTIKEKEPEKRFSWGFQAGLGMTPKGLLPYVGVGATIKF